MNEWTTIRIKKRTLEKVRGHNVGKMTDNEILEHILKKLKENDRDVPG